MLLLFLAPGSMNVDNCRYYPYIDLLFSFPAQLDSVHEKYYSTGLVRGSVMRAGDD